MRVCTFAYLRNAQDGTNPEHQAASARVGALGARLGASVAFVDSETWTWPTASSNASSTTSPRSRPTACRSSACSRPDPTAWAPRPRACSPRSARCWARPTWSTSARRPATCSSRPSSTPRASSHPNSFSLYETSYEAHPDTDVRRGAWGSFTAGLKAYNNTFAATIATEVKKSVVLARLRGHRNTEEYLLQSHQVPQSLYTRHPGDHPHRARPAHAALPAPAPPRAGPRQGASLRPARAPGRRLRAADRVRGGVRHAARLAGPDGRRLRGLRAHRAGRALGRPRRQRRQVDRRVLLVALRRAPVHPDHVGRHHAQRVHAGARAGPRGALRAGDEAPALRQHAPGHAVHRGAVDHARDAAGAAHPGRQRRPAHPAQRDHAAAGHLPPQLRHPPAGGRAAAPRVRHGRGRAGGDGHAAEPHQGRGAAGVLGRRGGDRRRRAHDLDAPAALLHGPVPVHVFGRTGGRDGHGPARGAGRRAGGAALAAGAARRRHAQAAGADAARAASTCRRRSRSTTRWRTSARWSTSSSESFD